VFVPTNVEQSTSPQTPVVPTNVEQPTSPQIPVVPTNVEQSTSPQIPVVNLNELTQTTSQTSPGFENNLEQLISPQTPLVNSNELSQTSGVFKSTTQQPTSPQTPLVNSNELSQTSVFVPTNVEQSTSPQIPVVPTNVEQPTSPQIPVVNLNELTQTTSEISPGFENNLEQPTSPQIPSVNLNELTQTTSEISPVFEPTTQQSQPTSFQTPSVSSNELSQTSEIFETNLEQPTSPQISQTTGDDSETENNDNVEKSKATQGFFTGGKVIESNNVNHKPIGTSDTVPAMLTPGEFVVNSKYTEENLPLLEHINQGGQIEDLIQDSRASDTEQTEENSSLVPPLLGANIANHKSSFTKNQILHNRKENNNGLVQKKSPKNNYSSPPLIFKKSNHKTSEQDEQNYFDTPTSWSNLQELMSFENENENFIDLNNENNSVTTSNNERNRTSNFQSFNSSQTSSNSQVDLIKKGNYTQKKQRKAYQSENIFQNEIFQKGEANSETIDAETDYKESDEIILESLAREIYKRLRQELEIEKERHGKHLGRLTW
jgi:hypothetical protein